MEVPTWWTSVRRSIWMSGDPQLHRSFMAKTTLLGSWMTIPTGAVWGLWVKRQRHLCAIWPMMPGWSHNIRPNSKGPRWIVAVNSYHMNSMCIWRLTELYAAWPYMTHLNKMVCQSTSTILFLNTHGDPSCCGLTQVPMSQIHSECNMVEELYLNMHSQQKNPIWDATQGEAQPGELTWVGHPCLCALKGHNKLDEKANEGHLVG